MKIVFVSNYYNHHQMPLCDNLNEATSDFVFIETAPMDEERKAMGWGMMELPQYVVQYDSKKEFCDTVINTYDVVIFGAAPYSLIKKRLHNNGLVYVYSERIFKNNKITLKKLFTVFMTFRTFFNRRNCFLLAASAYAPGDFKRIHCLKSGYYKWGYFPELKSYDIDKLISKKEPASILWVSRFIEWKHPETCVKLGKCLKENGISYRIDMIGVGSLKDSIKKLIREYDLEDSVILHEAMSPSQVRMFMEKSQIFLISSDRNEGWGAVLNESMNSGCAAIASSSIGSSPYLIDDGKNGVLYENEEFDDLYNKVLRLLLDDEYRNNLGRNGYLAIQNIWNADNAVKQFLAVSERYLFHHEVIYSKFGPCSKAEII